MAVLDLIPEKILPKKKKAQKGLSMPAIKVQLYQPEVIPRHSPVPKRLATKLMALGRRHRSVHVTEQIARIIAFAVMLITLQMFLDWMMNLSVLVRLVFLVADIALLVHYARKHLVPLLAKAPNIESSALIVEKHFPKLRGRIIAAVQLSKPGYTRDSPELVQAIQQDTDLRTATMNFNTIVPTRGMNRRLLIVFAVLAIWIGYLIFCAPGSFALLERVFLIPAKVPRKTDVVCLSGDKTIPQGESVLLEAEAHGIVPSHGRATLVDDTGRVQEIDMDREKDATNRFSLEVTSVDHPFSYTITLNDGEAGPYNIRTVPRPNVTSIECVQVYPAYTGLPDLKRSVGNLALLAGSKLKIHAITNSKVVKASIKLVGLDQTLPLTIAGTNDTDLTGQIDIPTDKLTGFSIQLTNEAGVTSGDQTQYRIDLIPDRPPSVDLTQPEGLQELNTLKAKPNLAFVATDDYGVAKLTLCYRFVKDQDDTTADTTDANAPPPAPVPPTRIPLDLDAKNPTTFKGHYAFDLSAIKPPITEGMTIEYWVEAEDSNNVTGPGIGDSEHHVIKVVSSAEMSADVMNRLLDKFSVMKEMQEHETKINSDLGQAIQGRPETSPAPAPAPVPAPAPAPKQ
jgi:hypothetical protein